MPDCEPIARTSDAQLAWMEHHAGRILIAGALVSGNIVLVTLVHRFYGLGSFEMLMIVSLALVAFLLLHRAVTRMTKGAVYAARREAHTSRHMMFTVEQIGTEAAGFYGTVEALASSAQAAGLEVYVWESTERSFWCPATNRHYPIVAGSESELMKWAQDTRPRLITGSLLSCPIPNTIVRDKSSLGVVAASMCSGGELLGLVIRRHKDKGALAVAEDEALVSAIASIGAVALGKAYVVDQEAARARDNELLLRSLQVGSEMQQKERLGEYIEQAVEASRAASGAMFVLDAGRLRLVGASGIDRINISGVGSIRLRSKLAQLASQSQGYPFHCGFEELDEASSIVLARLGFDDEVLIQSLQDDNGLVGLIILDQSFDAMATETDNLLAAIGHQASVAIERTKMLRSIHKRSKHLACSPKLARNLTGQRDSHTIARIAARELHGGFGFGRVSIALSSSKDNEIEIIASSGMEPAQRCACTPLIVECYKTGRPYVGLVADIDTVQQSVIDQDAPQGCKGRIFVPIVNSNRKVSGVIAVYEQNPDLLGEDDLHMLETVADQVAGALEQAELFDSLERSYFETVEALSTALEAKDAYTLDHARSITELTAEVGRRLGMRNDEIRDLKLGALLHDIGKIGIPTEIISKEGPLTDAEFKVMQDHTIIGERIIADVEFLQNVRPLVLHEHERWDGAGYPHGLREQEIPLGARIIFVCDSWHAMTSDRPYRSAMDHDDAIQQLRDGAGSQFDPEVVEIFCQVIASEINCLQENQISPADRVPC